MSIKDEVERIEELNQAIKKQFALAVVTMNGLSMATKSALESLDKSFVFVGLDISNHFELEVHNWTTLPDSTLSCVELSAPVKHGAYRQFIKRGMRKNFKLR
jgi:hypothetical protein